MINVFVRRRLRQSALALNTLHFWISLTQDRMDWNVVPKLLAPLVVFTVITAIPSALWAGAMAPVSTEAIVYGSTKVPAYDSLPSFEHLSETTFTVKEEVRTKAGIFSYSVGLKLFAQLVAAAASASPPDGSTPIRAKPDETQYVYNGRSYGIGSAVGLVSYTSTASNVSSYTFNETGYYPHVTCIYNETSAYGIVEEGRYPGVNFYDAIGYVPNSDLEEGPEYDPYASQSHYGTANLVAFGTTHALPFNRQRFVTIAAGKNYHFLNQTQCDVHFTPTEFEVSVSSLNRTIIVQPLLKNGTSAPHDIDPSGHLSWAVMRQITAVGHQAMGWDLAPLGQAFNSSIQNYKSAQNLSTSQNEPSNVNKKSDNLPGIASSMTAMIDDILIGFASAQIKVRKDTDEVGARFSVPAVEFGQEKYIYAVFVVNTVILLLVVLQACYTGLWRELPAFDCLDPRSIIIAAFRGGWDTTGTLNAVPAAKMFVKLQRKDEEADAIVGWYRNQDHRGVRSPSESMMLEQV